MFIQKLKKILPDTLFSYLKYIYSLPKYYINIKLFKKNNKLKNIHQGKRCFILGSGPSIKKEDLKPLKNEIVFALNNFYVHEDFQEIMSGSVDKYYMTAPIHAPQTTEEWTAWFTDMEKNIPNNCQLFFGLNARKENIKIIFEKNNLFKFFDINWYYATASFSYNSLSAKGLDITKPITSAEAVSVYALIIAVYMGFDEIVLLGMDHDYFLYDDEKDMRMYKSAIHQEDEFERTFGNDFFIDEFLRQYKIFKKYRMIDLNSNSKILDASDGGILKVFKKIKLKSLLESEI